MTRKQWIGFILMLIGASIAIGLIISSIYFLRERIADMSETIMLLALSTVLVFGGGSLFLFSGRQKRN